MASTTGVPPARADFLVRYELVKVLGEGTFGTVWSGRDRHKVRRREQVVKVAVKVVAHGGEDADLVRNEAEVHHKLFAGGGCSLLVRLLDALFEDTQAMLVLELFEGEALSARIDAAPQGRLSEAATAPIARQLAAALSFMHAVHVAHLDVKPENILVGPESSQRGVSPRMKLLDYGSARPMDRPDAPGAGALGLVQDAGGTDRYMSPERLALPSPRRWFGGAAADIYSLGIVVVHALLGVAAVEVLEAKAATMGRAAEAAAAARTKASRATGDAKAGALRLSHTMAKAAMAATAAAGSAAVQLEASHAGDVCLGSAAMDLLLSATRVEPSERPAAAELLRHEWILERRELQRKDEGAHAQEAQPPQPPKRCQDEVRRRMQPSINLSKLEAALPEHIS